MAKIAITNDLIITLTFNKTIVYAYIKLKTM